MSAAAAVELVTTLSARGVTLEAHGDRLRYWPTTLVQPEDVAQLKALKRDVLLLLAEDDQAAMPPRCRRCEGPTVWVQDWPLAGTDAWRCTTCERTPEAFCVALFLAASPEDQTRVRAEAQDGDPSAQRIIRDAAAWKAPR